MHYTKPSILHYRIAQAASWLVATLVFKRKVLRNEIKGKTGPFVVIANHQAALDFVNLIGLRHRPMSFVISSSFYNSLPLKGFMDKMGIIPKQQFQTTIADMRKMKAVIKHGEGLVIYPAGLMCEDGLSTPIPAATYKFLKWLDADVYVARTCGTYFAMPKWGKGFRPGRTTVDVYKLLSRDELAAIPLSELKELTDGALLFDAYREQDERRFRYKNGGIDGLEQVLYLCPHCGGEFTMRVRDGNTMFCTQCGYEQFSDEFSLLHNQKGIGPEIRYASDWSRMIYDKTRQLLLEKPDFMLSSDTTIQVIDPQKNKFVAAGRGKLTMSNAQFLLEGQLHGEEITLTIPTENIPALPFSPGKYLEIQHGSDIYRCVLDDGKLVMKLINMVKIFHELHAQAQCAGSAAES